MAKRSFTLSKRYANNWHARTLKEYGSRRIHLLNALVWLKLKVFSFMSSTERCLLSFSFTQENDCILLIGMNGNSFFNPFTHG